MKKRIAVLLAVTMLFGVVLAGCKEDPNRQLEKALSAYSQIMEDPLPEDITLTIYYMSPQIYTPYPYSAEDLINSADTKKIVVAYDALSAQLDMLKKLDASVLRPCGEETCVNARLYYVMETNDSGKLLEVVSSLFQGPLLVNGVPVEDKSVFYEMIDPFLTEEDRQAMGAVFLR